MLPPENHYPYNSINYREILQQLALPVILINKEGNIVDANHSAYSTFGYCTSELMGMEFGLILQDLPIECMDAKHSPLLCKTIKGECNATHKNSSIFPIEYSSTILMDTNGKPLTCVTIKDISKRKVLEKKMPLMNNQTEESFMLLDTNLTVVSFNKQFQLKHKSFDYKTLVHGKSIFDFVKPEKKELLEAIFNKALAGKHEKVKISMTLKNEATTFLNKYSPLKNDNGEIIGILVSYLDISAEENAQKKAAESELRYRKLFNDNLLPTWIIDAETLQFLKVNKSACLKYGYSKQEFINMSIFDLEAPTFHDKCTQSKIKSLGKPSLLRGSRKHLLKNGSKITVEVTSAELNFRDKKSLLVMALDITERINAEKHKEFEKRHKEALINSTNDQIWSLTPQYELLAANMSFIKLLKLETGITYKRGDNLMQLHPYTSNFLHLWKSDFNRAVAGNRIIEIKHLPATENSPESWVEIKCNPIFENDKVMGVACHARNITERKLAEEKLKENEAQLAEAQRLAKLGNWHRDIKNERLAWSKELHNITGIDINTPINERGNTLKYVDKKDRKRVKVNGDLIRKTGDSYEIVYHATTPKGERKIFEERGYGVKDDKGNVISLFGTLQDITERKLAEEEIKNALKEKETILESIGDAFFAVDKNWEVTYWNKKAGALLGKSKDEMIGNNLWNIFRDYADSKSYFKYHLALKNNEIIHFEDFYHSANKWLEIDAYPSENGLSVYFKDITHRKIAEENIRITNERYNLVAQATNDSIWDLDITRGLITRTGSGFKLIFGYSNHHSTDINFVWQHLIHSDDADRIKKSAHHAFNNPKESYWEEEYRFLKKDGQYAYVNDRGFIIRDSNNKAVRMIGATQDVTRQKEHVKEIKRIQQNLGALINTTSDFIWSLDIDFKIITSNKAYNEYIYSQTSKKVIEGDYVLSNFPNPELNHWAHLYERAFLGEKFSSEEKIYNEAEDDFRYLLVAISPMMDKENKVVGVACIAKDITELKRSANLLQKSEKQFSDLFQMSPQPMWLYEQGSFMFTEVNQAMVKHYGYTKAELLQMTIMDIRPKEDIIKTKEIIQRRRWDKSDMFHEKFRHFKKNGELIDVQIYSTPLVVNDKNYTMVIAIDITEKLRYEQKITKAIIQAQENERYEIGGELHDNVCQLLASSKMSISMLKKVLPTKELPMLEQSKEYISMALDEIRNISHRMAPTFFNDKTMEEAFEKFFLNFNMGEKYNIKLDFDEATKMKPISTELQLNLYRILQEQMRNISKYANATNIEINVITFHNNLKMRIADNGKGFDTDKASDGIGLGNMKRRAELFNGKFEIFSKPGQGCEIEVTIPY